LPPWARAVNIIDVFGLDGLVNMAAPAGLRVRLSIRNAA